MENITLKRWFFMWLSICNKPQGLLEQACQAFTLFGFAMLVICPIMTITRVVEVSGSIPPQVPMINSSGSFVFVNNLPSKTNHYYVDFHDEHGKVYRMTEWTMPESLIEFSKKVPPVEVNVQGFILDNGKGDFFPLQINRLDGEEVMSTTYALSQLEHHRNAERSFFILANSFFLFFLIGSIFFTYFAVNRKLKVCSDR